MTTFFLCHFVPPQVTALCALLELPPSSVIALELWEVGDPVYFPTGAQDGGWQRPLGVAVKRPNPTSPSQHGRHPLSTLASAPQGSVHLLGGLSDSGHSGQGSHLIAFVQTGLSGCHVPVLPSPTPHLTNSNLFKLQLMLHPLSEACA